MNGFEFESVYNGSVVLITIGVVLVVFLAWQWRRRYRSRRRPPE